MQTKKTIFPSNLHAHTFYCDGKNNAEDYILTAIEKGFTSVGLSGHSFTAFDTEPCMTEQGTQEYLKELKKLKEKYKNKMQVYIGIEADFYTGYNKETDKEMGLDFRIGSVHYVKDREKDEYYCVDNTPEILKYGIKNYANEDERAFIEAYFDNIVEMVHTQKPDIIGHLDLVRKFNKDLKYFDENADWYRKKVEYVLDEIAKTDTIIEINTGGMSRGAKTDTIIEINTGGMSRGWTQTPYPSVPILERILAKNIPITISSDAHETKNIDFYFEESLGIARKVGFKSVKILDGGEFRDFKI